MNNKPKRFVISRQPNNRGVLADYKRGCKINLPPMIYKNFFNSSDRNYIKLYLQKNGWKSSILKEEIFTNLRVIEFIESSENKTKFEANPDRSKIYMKKGMKLNEKARSVPLRIYLGIHNACNCNCLYCCASATINRPGYFSVKEINEISKFLYSIGVIEIRLGESGECTLHPNFKEIVKTIKKNGLFLSVNTNGVMPEETRKFIARSGYVDLLIQSLDGINEAHDRNRGKGCFDEAIKTINAIAPYIKTRFNFVVNGTTHQSLEDLAKLAYYYGAEIYTLPQRPSGRGAKNFEEYLKGVSWEDIIIRMTKLREKYPGLVLYSTYDVFMPGGDYLVDHEGSCPAGIEAACVSPVVEDRKGEYSRIRTFGCSFMADIHEKNLQYPFLAKVFEDTEDFYQNFFDSWQKAKGFEIFRAPYWKDTNCLSCIMLKEHRCTGHCAALAYYKKNNKSFEASIYCALKASEKFRLTL